MNTLVEWWFADDFSRMLDYHGKCITLPEYTIQDFSTRRSDTVILNSTEFALIPILKREEIVDEVQYQVYPDNSVLAFARIHYKMCPMCTDKLKDFDGFPLYRGICDECAREEFMRNRRIPS